jgi:predicted transcriptional regulator
MKTLRVGIASREAYKKRTLAIAKGEYVRVKDEPKVWFESLGTLSQVLSDQNQNLLNLILETHPRSMSDLAAKSGRKTSNLSRTLRTMERYGLVRLEKGANRQLVPRVNYTGVELKLSFQKWPRQAITQAGVPLRRPNKNVHATVAARS